MCFTRDIAMFGPRATGTFSFRPSETKSLGGGERAPPRVMDTPEDLHLEAIANSICLHPSRDMIVCGDLDGDVYAFEYSCTEGQTRELWSSGHHMKSCRAVRLSADGQRVFTVSRDKAVHLLEAESGKLVTRIKGAHSAPINALRIIDENLLATGDDNGALKVWDMRKGTSIMDFKHHDDYISDITVDQAKRILLTARWRPRLTFKRRRFELLSEPQGKKVVCGSSEGTVYIFNWNGFGATSDRFALKAESVDCILPLSDSVMCTASMDGYIRAVHLLPNRVLGCVGQHVGEPIEELASSHCGRFLASTAHDQSVRFWDVSALRHANVQTYRKRKRKDGRLKALSKKALGENDFFHGLREEEEKQEEEEESEDSDSD
uniref:WD repeat domain 55 n=1 Tax=Neogobius melanostomus TaxID=47308 RepID=A0A8C6T1H8_9GOBI